jgi:hypothetical protein
MEAAPEFVYHPLGPYLKEEEDSDDQMELLVDEGRRGRGRPRKSKRPAVPKMTKASDFGLEKFICVLCQRPYQTIAYLNKHMAAKHRICQPVVQVKCEFCGSTFADQDQFQMHAEGARGELSRTTGVVAQLRQDQVAFSRVLRTFAHEEAVEDGERNREVLERNFNYPGVEEKS